MGLVMKTLLVGLTLVALTSACSTSRRSTGGGGGGSSNVCGLTLKNLACDIRDNSQITLLTINPSGVNDGADPHSNIVDTCNGQKARRSSYGNAPGGSVCLTAGILRYLHALGWQGYHVQVNAIAGASHSRNSYHYQGRSVDLQVRYRSPSRAWMNMCASSGGIENLGPGDAGHSTHTHCTI